MHDRRQPEGPSCSRNSGAAELGRIEARLASQNIRLDGKLTARQRSYPVTQVGDASRR